MTIWKSVQKRNMHIKSSPNKIFKQNATKT